MDLDLLVNFLDRVENFFLGVGFLPLLLVIYVCTLVLFWYESQHVKKNRNSIFDQWFITTFAMIFWGRASYILTHWSEYANWYWFSLPYEKYGDSVYFFRAMPWRLLNLADGGFLFISMFVAYLIVSFIYVVIIKKWRWREMMLGVLTSANFMLGATLFIYGIYLQQEKIRNSGFLLLLSSMIFQVLLGMLKRTYRKNVEGFVKIAQFLIVLYAIAHTAFISYTFLSEGITKFDVVQVYVYLVFTAVSIFSYIYDLGRDRGVINLPRSIGSDLYKIVGLKRPANL